MPSFAGMFCIYTCLPPASRRLHGVIRSIRTVLEKDELYSCVLEREGYSESADTDSTMKT